MIPNNQSSREEAMQTPGKPSITPDPIFQLASGFMASKMFFAAGDLNLFTILGDGPATAEELAARADALAKNVRVVADAMVALGMLTKDDGRYRNSEVAQVFLSGKTPADFRPMLKFWDRLSYPGWTTFNDAVRHAEPVQHAFEFSPEDQVVFSAGVEAASRGGAMALAESYDFGRHKRLLDIGGGTGSFLRIIRRRHPHLSMTLFELPGTAAYARTRFSHDEAAAIGIVEGDMFKSALPSGYDAAILAHILHGFDEKQCGVLLKRVHGGMPKGGRLLIVDWFLTPDRTAPVMATLMSGEFLTHANGRSYSAAEVSEWLEEVGWTVIGQQPLAGPVSLLAAEK
jgi:ubiquinone/menaquinone biosynthesis C-methylase UbiE